MSISTPKRTFDDFIGNKQAVDKLKLFIDDGNLPHMGFFGPSGHGKTKLAGILSDEVERHFCYVNSVAVKSPMIFRGLITHPDNCKRGAIVLLDECHRLPKSIQDSLLSVLEQPAVLVTSYKDQIMRDYLPSNITFIFATTHSGYLNEAILSRLEPIEFVEYTPQEKQKMVMRYLAREHKFNPSNLTVDGIYEIAFRARSGRDVVRYTDNILRYMRQNNEEKLTKEVAIKVFDMFGIDANGLMTTDRSLLNYLSGSGSVGLDTLEAFLHVSKKEIKDKVEPFLLRKGFIMRQASGRMITPLGLKALSGERVVV